ncbi:hypothetical protein BMMON2_49280 [Burkholderia mallei]
MAVPPAAPAAPATPNRPEAAPVGAPAGPPSRASTPARPVVRRPERPAPYCPIALLPYCPIALLPYCPIAPFDIVYRFDRGTDAAADSRLAFFASIDDPTHLPASRGHHAREAAPRIRSTPQRQNDRTTDRIAAREPPLRLAAGLRSISTETCP